MLEKDYVIRTFNSERESNYDIAIKFYRQKTDALLNSLKNEVLMNLNQNIQSIENIDEIFEKGLEQAEKGLASFEALYNQKISGSVLQERIAEFNQSNQAITEGLENGFETAQFLNMLAGQQVADISDTSLPNTIDLSAQSKVLKSFSTRGYGSAAAAGGARARLMGEIMEQLALQLAQGNLQTLFKTFTQTGAFKTQSFNSKLTYGKSDLLFTTADIDYQQLDTGETVGNINQEEVQLDLNQAVDLNDREGAQQLLDQYTTGSRALIGGMTVKQWSNNVLGQNDATFAHSKYTQNLINQRFPNHAISEGFSERATFNLYTAYVISRFLINVIGVYNILVSNASEITTTAAWLQGLKKQYMLEHEIKVKNSLYTAKDTIHVGKIPG